MTHLRPGQWLTIVLIVFAVVALVVLLTGLGLPHAGSPLVGPQIH